MNQEEKKSREELENEVKRLKREVEALKTKSEPIMNSILGLQQAVIQLDATNNLIYANKKASELGGFDRKAKGLKLSDIDFFPFGEGVLATLVNRASEQDGTLTSEQALKDPTSGQQKFWKISVTCEPLKAQILFEDITSSKALERFESIVAPDVFAELVSHGGSESPFEAKKMNVSVVFADLRGFTRATSDMPPEVVQRFVNKFLNTMVKVAYEHKVTVDKFLGDNIMLISGAPNKIKGHAARALRCSFAMQNSHKELVEEFESEGLPFLGMGIGINSGPVMAGWIGSDQKVEYTVLGSSVNMASRFCSKADADEIVIGPGTLNELQQNRDDPEMAMFERDFKLRDGGMMEVKGVNEPVKKIMAFEVT